MKRTDAEKVVGEIALLRRIRLRCAAGTRGRIRLGIGDDCALLRLRDGEEAAVTTDLSIAGRHFELDWHPPEAVGHRTLARGLSDLAAMGARPVAAFLSLGLPRELTAPSKNGGAKRAWVDRFYDGLLALAETHKTPLAGGDLAESPVAVADIVLVGTVPRGRALRRRGARPGDEIYVTGTLGGAAAGLAALSKLERKTAVGWPRIPRKLNALLASHLYPQPRVAVGLYLQSRGLATAALDLSDGLSTDLEHLCEESGVHAHIAAELLPIHPAATTEQALHGGEDYELLFTARPGLRLPRTIAGVPIARIGRMVSARLDGPVIAMSTGCVFESLQPRGWEHFS